MLILALIIMKICGAVTIGWGWLFLLILLCEFVNIGLRNQS